MASLFSNPKISTIHLDSSISHRPSTNDSIYILTEKTSIDHSKSLLTINNRTETTRAISQDVSKFEIISDSPACLGGHIAKRLVEVVSQDVSKFEVTSDSPTCLGGHIAKRLVEVVSQDVSKFEVTSDSPACLGGYIARRLIEVGITDIFTVPGDFNLILLDHLISQPGLNNIGCCNEINAGYAADGYARCRGVGACVVTFTVGGLSVINAIAGSYSENLPIICLVGGPNSNDYGSNRILHHTIGIPDFSQELQCFQQVTCYQVFSI